MLKEFLKYFFEYYDNPREVQRFNRNRYLKWRYNRVLNDRFENELREN